MRARHYLLLTGLLLVPVVTRLALLPKAGAPLPRVHDEFSYLLSADTFAHGRLTNPPHPLWEFFETFHAIQQPTYSSKYPPGQGLAMALGQVTLGNPWFGVVAGYVIMMGSFAWMFRGWLPSRLALLAAALPLVRYPISHYWLNSYWGGCLAAAGGALFIGAMGRMRRRIRPGGSAMAGLGLVVLAMTRPFEGSVLALCLTAAMTPVLLRQRSQWRAGVPGLVVVMLGLGFIALHNSAVTGSPWTLPYFVHERQYVRDSSFWFQTPREGLIYRHAEIERFLGQPQSWPGFDPRHLGVRVLQLLELVRLDNRWEAFVQVAFGWAAILALPFIWRRRALRPILVAYFASVCLLLLTRLFFEHYTAPLAGLRLLVVASAARRFGAAKALCPAAFVCVLVVASHGLATREASGFAAERDAVRRQLFETPGRHVVIVRYGTGHDVHKEWVYNAAGIEASRVIWARDMGEDKNRRLRLYFSGRRFWLLEPDRSDFSLTPQ